MYAIRQHTFGGPETLALTELPDLSPATDQVRIQVEAAGVHFIDTKIREDGAVGPHPALELPMTPGREVAGVVDALGHGVDPAWRGRPVVAHLGSANGGYASQAVAPVDALIGLPEDRSVDPADAVAAVGTGRTTLAVLNEAQIGPDDVVLVTAAAGGIGTLAVQAATKAGAVVVGAAGGPTKHATVEALGADLAVDYRQPGWADRVRETLGNQQVTVALDGVGGAVGRAVFELIGPGGRMVLFGYSSGETMPLHTDDLFTSGVTVTAAVGARMLARPGGVQAVSQDAVAKLVKGEWRPVIHRFALADAAEAHRSIAARTTIGKVVLTTQPPR